VRKKLLMYTHRSSNNHFTDDLNCDEYNRTEGLAFKGICVNSNSTLSLKGDFIGSWEELGAQNFIKT
jgi:hypothetical protein